MSPNGQFGTNDLRKALKKLKFTPQKQSGSSHQKWRVPKNIKISSGQRPFIIVIQGKKTYIRPTCDGYIKQLLKFGFTFDDLKKCFKKRKLN